jgi:hypothetical protein
VTGRASYMRGRCPECGRNLALTKAGTVPLHRYRPHRQQPGRKAPATAGRTARACAGSGQVPA